MFLYSYRASEKSCDVCVKEFEEISKHFSTFLEILVANDNDDEEEGRIENISEAVSNALMMDACYSTSADDIVEHLNAVLMYVQESAENSLSTKKVEVSFHMAPKTVRYKLFRWVQKFLINTRRIFRANGLSMFVFGIVLALSLCPIMALLLLDHLGTNDLFMGICFSVFFPFLYVTVAVCALMGEQYEILYSDLEDGIYGSSVAHRSFSIYYSAVGNVIGIVSLLALFVIRPHTTFDEMFNGNLF